MSNVSYNELKEAFEKVEQIEKQKEGYSEMSILRPKPGDIIAAYFNFNEIDAETAQQIHQTLVKILPEDVSVITLPDESYLIDYNEQDFIREIFDSMDNILGRQKFIEALYDEINRLDGDGLK